MKRLSILLISLSLLSLTAWASPHLSKEECHAIVKDFEQISNTNPPDIESKARETLDDLRNGETLTSYFIAFNIYAENLFNKGKIEESYREIEQMIKEAMDQPDVECKVIALRAQGQFYYKLGLYERASDCFRKAMEMCPRYDSDLLEHCFTWSSTLFWLVQTDIHTGRIDEAQIWINRMDDMMKWLDSNGNIDQIGYKPVMILGLKAKIELLRGDTVNADKLLRQCPQYIRADIPSRAYVEYYVARMLLLVAQGLHEEALPILDDLIAMHITDYKPIAAEFILQKGMSLGELGRYQQSAKAFSDYIELKDHVNQMAIAQQLDELTTRYNVEKIRHERDNIRRQLLIVIAVCVALAVIITLIIVNQKRLRKKNRLLANNISELNRILRETPPTAGNDDYTSDPAPNPELLETGFKIVEFINNTQCYLSHNCSRDTLKEGLGVSERTLAKAIVAATGMSFVNYINTLRLKASIEMLDEKPEMTISDISTACGFGTVRQFQRLFKQNYGLTPSAYREARNASSPSPRK